MPWYTSEIFSMFMFFVPPITALLVLYFIRKKLVWIAIPITLLLDTLFWGPAIAKAGSYGGTALMFLIPRVIVVMLISLLIMRKAKKAAK